MKQRASDLPRSSASDDTASDDTAERLPRPETLNDEAWALYEAEPRRARDLAGRALELARREAHDLECAKALRTLGACELALGRPAQAREALEEALALLGPEPGRPALRVWLERLLLRSDFQTQRYPEALRRGHRALELARELADEREEARALNDLGFVCAHLSAFEEGLGYLLQSLELHERLGTAQLGSPLNNVGNVYLQQDKPAEARAFFERAAKAFAAGGKRLETAIAHGNLGRAAEALGELDEARAEHERSLALLRELEQPSYLAAGLTKLAGVLAKQGEHAAALERYHEALALQAGRGAFRDETLLGLAELRLMRGEPEQALECYREVLAMAEASGDARLTSVAHEGLSRAFEALGDAAAALEHYRRHHACVREHERALTSGRTTALLLQHELEQARREQALLREQNQALAEAHGQLRALHEELSDKAAQLERLSLEDALTGLHNRRYLMRGLAAEVERAARLGQSVSVMLFDIDAFKRVNDDFSHAVGDLVLEAVAEITRRQVRRIDIPARLGGEEFVVVFPQTGLEQAARAAERLRAAVEAHPWAALQPGLSVTISAGVAAWASRQGPEALLAAADAKLYAAKHGGKNRVVS